MTKREKIERYLNDKRIASYRAGELTVQKIADACGCSFVYAYITTRRVVGPVVNANHRALVLSDDDLSAYAGGTASIRELARKLGCSVQTIRNALGRAGVSDKTREAIYATQKHAMDVRRNDISLRIRSLVDEGKTLQQIGDALGFTRERARQYLWMALPIVRFNGRPLRVYSCSGCGAEMAAQHVRMPIYCPACFTKEQKSPSPPLALTAPVDEG